MRILFLAPGLLALAACQDEDLPAVDPSVFQDAEAACARDDGRWVPRGDSNVMACLRPTGEEKKRCTSSRDCQGLCLARSGTCAPVVPLFGCNEVLGANGAPSTVCLE